MRCIRLALLIAVSLLMSGTLVPPPLAARQTAASLSPESAAEVRALARFGRGTIRQLVWSADGQILAIATSIGVALADWRGDSPTSALVELASGATSAAFSPDSRLLAIGAGDGALHLWDVETGDVQATLAAHLYELSALAFNASGDRLASADASGIVRVWALAPSDSTGEPGGESAPETMAERLVIESAGTPERMAFSPGDTLLAVAGTAQTHMIDLQSGALLAELPVARHIAFHPSGDALALVSLVSRTDQLSVIQQWDPRLGQPLSATVAARSVVDIRYGAGDRLTVYTTAGGELVATDLQTRLVAETTPVSPDAVELVIGPRRIAERTSAERVFVYPPVQGWDSPARATALFSPEFVGLALQPDAIIAYGDRLARRFDLASGNVSEIPVPPSTPGIVTDGAPGGSGRVARFGSESGSGVVRLETTGDSPTQRLLTGHAGTVRAAAFSPDGSRLATAGDDSTIHLWDAASGDLLTVLRGHIRSVYGLAFSPDGRLLASASLDRAVRLWDAATFQPLAVLEGHTSGVTAVAFTPDGSRLASTSFDGTVRVWGRPS